MAWGLIPARGFVTHQIPAFMSPNLAIESRVSVFALPVQRPLGFVCCKEGLGLSQKVGGMGIGSPATCSSGGLVHAEVSVVPPRSIQFSIVAFAACCVRLFHSLIDVAGPHLLHKISNLGNS